MCGASVGGRVLQTRGVTLSAPNCTVSLIGISRCEMRPVTLSSAAKMAIGFWTFSALAGVAPNALDPCHDQQRQSDASLAQPRFRVLHHAPNLLNDVAPIVPVRPCQSTPRP